MSSWAATAEERRLAALAGVQAAASFVGPIWPLAMWGVEWVYNRRDLIFDLLGVPRRAYTADQAPLALTSLRTVSELGMVSISTPLTDAARRAGLRDGDPVGVVVARQKYVRNRSGLVVPTRIGEQVDVSVPPGAYSLTGFAAQLDALFTTADPYHAMAGRTLFVAGTSQLDLSLTERPPVPPDPSPEWLARLTMSRGECDVCGEFLADGGPLKAHRRRAHGQWWQRLYQSVGNRW